LCLDTHSDPYFIEGSPNARSSMTVPLIFQDQVIGTLNVESPEPQAFTNESLQFAELFSRELAQTLYTLNLLSAQQNCTAAQAIDAVNREIALPADELLSIASRLVEKAQTLEPDWVNDIKQVIADTRSIKERIQVVGDQFAPRAKLSTKRLRGLHILVVDSDERIRRSAHAMLEKLGCQVETAATATEGIALAHWGTFDGVLLDIRHPDMGGYAAYSAIKLSQPTAQVVLTAGFGYDSSHTIVKARQDGLKHLIFKPFRLDQLLKIFS
jgi:two-component system, sensor histidine kinase SagS